MNPTVTSFVFSPFYSLGEVSGGLGSIIICFVPRILVGVTSYYAYVGILKLYKNKRKGLMMALGGAGIVGALTNTLLVMNLIFVFFKDAYANVNGVANDAVYTFILSIIGINGIPEAIVAAIIVAFVGRILVWKFSN